MDESNHPSRHGGTAFRLGSTSTGTQGPDIVVSGHGQALPAGFRLGNFEVVSVVGVGGFGIVYKALDLALEREVAIKEYMPGVLADRTADYRISVKSEEARDTFVTGLRSFVNEARLLARFSHPALVSVLSYWEDHGTAYMVMPFYEGVTLKRVLRGQPAPDEAWIRQVFAPVLDVLDMLHQASCLHRDVAPDNILMLSGERPLLLDLGAARQVVGEATQALTAILKPAYAPIEQYSSDGTMRQGPWTDVYACAAVLHWVVTGHAPPTAVERLNSEQLPRLDALPEGRYRAGFLEGIRAGLRLRPPERPQDIASFRALLFDAVAPAATGTAVDDDATRVVALRAPSGDAPSGHAAKASAPEAFTTPVTGRPEGRAHTASAPATAAPASAAAANAAPASDLDQTRVVMPRASGAAAAPAPARAVQPDAPAVPHRTSVPARLGARATAAVAACLVLAAGGWWWHQRGDTASPGPAPAAVAPAPVSAPTPAVASPAAPAPVATPAAAAPEPAPPAATAANPPEPAPPAATGATMPESAPPANTAARPPDSAPPAPAAHLQAVTRPPAAPPRPAVQVAGTGTTHVPKRAEGAVAVGASAECREAQINVSLGNDSADDLARLKAACAAAPSR